MGWCEVCDPEVSGHCTGFPEWVADPYATAYLFDVLPIAIALLDACDKLPIPGQFMEPTRTRRQQQRECNQGIYEALLVSYVRSRRSRSTGLWCGHVLPRPGRLR